MDLSQILRKNSLKKELNPLQEVSDFLSGISQEVPFVASKQASEAFSSSIMSSGQPHEPHLIQTQHNPKEEALSRKEINSHALAHFTNTQKTLLSNDKAWLKLQADLTFLYSQDKIKLTRKVQRDLFLIPKGTLGCILDHSRLLPNLLPSASQHLELALSKGSLLVSLFTDIGELIYTLPQDYFRIISG
jgi:hypothetical protein